MGCGISTLDAEDVSSRRRSNRVRNHVIAPPIVENKKLHNQNIDYDGVVVANELEAKTKEEGFNTNEDKLKEKSVVDQKEKEKESVVLNNENRGNIIVALHVRDDDDDDNKHVKNEEEENNEDIDDRFIGPGSPSFRDYCNDFDSVDQSSLGESNDCDSEESSKNSSSDDDHSTNKLRKEKNVDSTKEPEKRVRRGRFRNVMNKGKARGKKNLLNFACYNSSTQSYAEGSFHKIVEKTA